MPAALSSSRPGLNSTALLGDHFFIVVPIDETTAGEVEILLRKSPPGGEEQPIVARSRYLTPRFLTQQKTADPPEPSSLRVCATNRRYGIPCDFHPLVVPAVLAWGVPQKKAWMGAGWPHPSWVCLTIILEIDHQKLEEKNVQKSSAYR
jgi:hypothetical protein